MRITNLMTVDHAIQNVADNLEKMNKLQNRASLGKQFQNASDDPARASVSLSLRSNLNTLESFSQTAELAQNWMTASDSALDQLEQISNRATNLILRGLTDTLQGSERASTLATEMKTLVSQAVEIGNTSLNGQAIFAGYQVNGKAFEMVDSAPLLDYKGDAFTPQVIHYIGDQGSMQRSLGPDQSVTLNVRGDQAILGFLQNLQVAYNALMQNNVNKTGDPVNDPLTLQSALTGLQSSLNVLDQYRTSNGARLRQTESAAGFLDTVQLETKNLLSKNEDVNVAEGIVMLANQQTTYQALLEVSQRAISALSLFDYLR